MAQTFLNDYILEPNHRIGRGASSVVYLGHHRTSGEKVAIKKIYIGNDHANTNTNINTNHNVVRDKSDKNDRNDRDKADFNDLTSDNKLGKLWNEINIMKKLKHPNIVSLYHVQMDIMNGYIYLVMEYCSGSDLSSFIDEYALDMEEIHRYMTQIKDALEYLRAKGIVHRDLKPHNILIHEGNIKLADFGLSILSETDTDLMKTICGSPLYMSPELIEHKKYTAKSDLWSVGIIFYQLIYRKHPYNCQNFQELTQQIKHTPIIYPPQPPVDALTMSLLQALLNKNCHNRITWESFFIHPWFKYQHLTNKASMKGSGGGGDDGESSDETDVFFMSFENLPEDEDLETSHYQEPSLFSSRRNSGNFSKSDKKNKEIEKEKVQNKEKVLDKVSDKDKEKNNNLVIDQKKNHPLTIVSNQNSTTSMPVSTSVPVRTESQAIQIQKKDNLTISSTGSNNGKNKGLSISQFIVEDYKKNYRDKHGVDTQKKKGVEQVYGTSAPQQTIPNELNYSPSNLNTNSVGSNLIKYVGSSYKWLKSNIDY